MPTPARRSARRARCWSEAARNESRQGGVRPPCTPCGYFWTEEAMSPLKIKKGSSKHSAYDLRDPNADVQERHTLAVLVDNESGVLARVIGLFSGRGYNIESLTVAEVDHRGHRSRITIVTVGTPQVIDQIKAQLARM